MRTDTVAASDHLVTLAGKGAMAGLSVAGGPCLSILIFHRVLAEPDPIFPAEVDVVRFDRFMALVARCFRVLPLSQAAGLLAQGRLPPRALCITFDDGYADNHALALPVLQRHRLPACFFIATGFLDGGRMFNDTVIECVRQCRLPRLDLADFGLGQFLLDTPAARARCIGALLPVVKYTPPAERGAALGRLQQLCQPQALPDDLMMTRAQVQAMHAAGMEIGAHTVHHPILSSVPDAEAEGEIIASRQVLQGLIDRPVDLLAYPNGRPDRDYDHRHAQMARRLGFTAAVSTAEGVSRPGADLFQLPRFTPWDQRPAPWLARLVATRGRAGYAVSRDAPPARAAAAQTSTS